MEGPVEQRRDRKEALPMERVLYEVKKVIVGQDHLLERLIVALLARGHILVEGVPGLAKTMAIKTMAESIGGEFKRIQFTPDLVPADLIGTRIYNQKTGDFSTSLGPVFTNLLLADEINRAPAKVQSALLEVMQERQVTIGRETFHVPDPFLVLATQNPIETAGIDQSDPDGTCPGVRPRPRLRPAPGRARHGSRRHAPPARALVRGAVRQRHERRAAQDAARSDPCPRGPTA